VIVTKSWGTTECIVDNPFMQLHRICVMPRGYCSIHSHQYRSNVFYVERGLLEVSIYNEHGTYVNGAQLFPGQKYTVPPNVLHSFRAHEHTVAYEAYHPEPVQSEDIIRKTIGGIHP
jgi:mannose-6-phosphate isomerase-like protein (cupin superfamily)